MELLLKLVTHTFLVYTFFDVKNNYMYSTNVHTYIYVLHPQTTWIKISSEKTDLKLVFYYHQARGRGVEKMRERMFLGDKINFTEVSYTFYRVCVCVLGNNDSYYYSVPILYFIRTELCFILL